MLNDINESYIQCEKVIKALKEIQHENDIPGKKHAFLTTPEGIMIYPNTEKFALQNLLKQSDVERIQNTLILMTGQIMNYEKNKQTKNWVNKNKSEEKCFINLIKMKIEAKDRRKNNK